MCPDSELITLRTLEDGTYLYNLSKEERISKIEPIEPEEYLKIHGIEMERSLVFKGQKIPVDEVSMQKGAQAFNTEKAETVAITKIVTTRIFTDQAGDRVLSNC